MKMLYRLHNVIKFLLLDNITKHIQVKRVCVYNMHHNNKQIIVFYKLNLLYYNIHSSLRLAS